MSVLPEMRWCRGQNAACSAIQHCCCALDCCHQTARPRSPVSSPPVALGFPAGPSAAQKGQLAHQQRRRQHGRGAHAAAVDWRRGHSPPQLWCAGHPPLRPGRCRWVGGGRIAATRCPAGTAVGCRPPLPTTLYLFFPCSAAAGTAARGKSASFFYTDDSAVIKLSPVCCCSLAVGARLL